MAKRPAKPPQSNWISACLTAKDIDASVAFYEKAFGFEKRFSMPGPGGKTVYADVAWQESNFMLGAEDAEGVCKSPASIGGVKPSFGLYVYCDDVDALYKRATAAGAKGEQPPQDMFWGDRMCTLIDIDGYHWSFATNVADFDPSKAPK